MSNLDRVAGEAMPVCCASIKSNRSDTPHIEGEKERQDIELWDD